MGRKPAVATVATEAHICNAQGKIEQLCEEVIQVNLHHTTLSAIHTGITHVQLFESEFIKFDITLAGHTIDSPIYGGIFKNKNWDKELIISWS
eukprot:7625483-Ditylum_brightwellii.AAC.1